MAFTELLGRYQTMWVRRRGPHGALLVTALDAPDDAPLLLLPNRDVPPSAAPDTGLEVFVYLDSEDRPTATVRRPRLALGEVTFLTCTDLTSFGAFFDWGLAKDLLVSKWEQLRDIRIGDRLPIGLVKDDTGRLAGTMRVSEMLDRRPELELGQWVDGELWRTEPGLGSFIILERKCLGLLPALEPHTLARGDAARCRVTAVHPDGKVELSLRQRAHEQLGDDGQLILRALDGPRPPRLGDHSSPDDVRALLGLSKKAFKRAVGRLLRDGLVRLDDDGIVTRVHPAAQAAAAPPPSPPHRKEPRRG